MIIAVPSEKRVGWAALIWYHWHCTDCGNDGERRSHPQLALVAGDRHVDSACPSRMGQLVLFDLAGGAR